MHALQSTQSHGLTENTPPHTSNKSCYVRVPVFVRLFIFGLLVVVVVVVVVVVDDVIVVDDDVIVATAVALASFRFVLVYICNILHIN